MIRVAFSFFMLLIEAFGVDVRSLAVVMLSAAKQLSVVNVKYDAKEWAYFFFESGAGAGSDPSLRSG
ncbi:hypothetical protein [Paracnuella aquatica]|uniref:hypothetical protein n=1 Tax=Paracnuella aquatica TaxID=2268757 RepID=UPI000F4F6338|nr:hypothetical protein [Paracnuella aquatica]RPD50661.1 hypothetical protein DRJ53_07000 [Paracnuella aquatica]